MCVDAMYYTLHLWHHFKCYSQCPGTSGLIWQETHGIWIFMLKFRTVIDAATAGNVSRYHCLLASGGRDRLIHLYDVDKRVTLVSILKFCWTHNQLFTCCTFVLEVCLIEQLYGLEFDVIETLDDHSASIFTANLVVFIQNCWAAVLKNECTVILLVKLLFNTVFSKFSWLWIRDLHSTIPLFVWMCCFLQIWCFL